MTVLFRSAPGRIGLLAGMLMPFPVLAQAGQITAAPSSQLELKTSDASSSLSTAMSTLAAEPRNLDALIAAGEAALKLEDPRAALGFFGRADDVSSNNGRVKAGLGRSMLALGQVGDGLRLMEQAVSLGYTDAALLSDRGLARDLTGNQAGAQQDYLAAMKLDPKNDTLTRRYAVSLGISGQVDLAEKAIEPLLYKNDRAAWRDRAFILAMNGRSQEALTITDKVMPKALADAIKPYMERMGMLTPGQRAAAVHLGQFPEGLVNVRIASTAVPARPPAVAAAAKPVEAKSRKNDKKDRKKSSRQAKADSSTRASTQAGAGASLAAVRPAPAPPPYAASQGNAPAQAPARTETKPSGAYEPVRIATTPSSSASSSSTSASRPVQGPPAPSGAAPASAARASSQPPAQPATPAANRAPAGAAAAAPGESTRTLADIMADIKVPASERKNDVVPVNLAEIAAKQAAERKAREAAEAKARKEEARRKAEAEARAKAAAEKKRLADNPERYWVQIGAGRNTDALSFTLRRMKRSYSVLAKQDGWWADYGRTKRLVVGPFRSYERAKVVENDLNKAGSDALVWHSDAGEEVHRIDGD